jgi:hypothetical protein
VVKTDRLYRTIKDRATLDERGFYVHFVREDSILSPQTQSTEQLKHGLMVLLARNLQPEPRRRND